MTDKPMLSLRLIEAYNSALHAMHDALVKAGDTFKPTLEERIEQASALDELGREEAERVRGYLRRDIEDAANWLADNGDELKDWLKFDIELVESKLFDALSSVADHTTVELKQFEEQATLMGEWHTGEIAGIGTLVCKSCDEHLHFHRTGHIPPCPKCHGTKFKRSKTA